MIHDTALSDGREIPIFIPQDPAQAGKSQKTYLTAQLAGYTVKSEPATGSKAVRASPFASQAGAGNVFIYRADWNEDFLAEMEAFPNGRHDDQVDAAASAFAMFITSDTGLFEFMKAQANKVLEAENELRRAMGLQPKTAPQGSR
jgi:predicted phage terminase large subunit-like protein